MSRRIAFRAILLAATLGLILSSVLSVQRSGAAVRTKSGQSGRGLPRGRTAKARNTGTNTTRQEVNSPKLWQQISDKIARKQSRSSAERKIDSQLLDVQASINSKVAARIPTLDATRLSRYSRRTLRVTDSGEIHVYAFIDDYTDSKITQLENAGMKVSRAYGEQNLVVGWIPYQSLTKVAQLSFVTKIRRPSYPITRIGRVTNEGDSVHRFDLVRSLFFSPNPNTSAGAGIRVGVMSDSTDHISLVQATGDAPPNPQLHIIQSPGDPNHLPFPIPPNTGDEGTALIELVHDIAPGAPITFYGPVDSADFLIGLTQLQGDQVKVIVDDLAFFDEPKFEDGPLAIAVRNFITNGGIYITSAGNDAENHYIGNFNPTNPPQSLIDQANPIPVLKVHNFASGGTDIGDSFVIPGDSDKNSQEPTNVPGGGDIVVALQWNNPFGNSRDDFDLYLIDDNTGNVLTSSADEQSGTGDDPNEVLEWVNDTASPINVSIVIAQSATLNTSPATNVKFNLLYAPFNFSDSNHQFNVASDSIAGHSAVEEAIVVAAADELTPNVPESFTSQGPATILVSNHNVLANPVLRNVPTVVGVDGISNRAGQLADPNTGEPFFISPFFGTSASAAQVAGMAALVWSSKQPLMTATQVRTAITSSAIPMAAGTPLPNGSDSVSGFGRADGVAAFSTLAGLTATPSKLGFVEVSNLSQPAINFGTVNVNTPSFKTITLINYGNTPLTVNSIGSPSNAAFVVTGGPVPSFTIAAGKTSAGIPVKFTPTSGGPFNATMQVTTNEGPSNTIALSGTGLASDANDNCANATVITSQSFSITQDTLLATNEGGDPNSACSANQPGTHTVWFKYRASTTGTTTINTFGSNYDTVLNVLTGSCGAFTPLTCNNDSPTAGKPPQSEVSFNAVANTTYFIEVSGPGGSLTLNGFTTITPPTDIELKVDDGGFVADDSVGLTNPPTPFYVVNRLTPSVYPSTLDQIKIQFLSGNGVAVGDQIKLIFAANPAGSGASDPQRLGISSTAFQTLDVVIPVLDQFFVYDVPDITIQSGDFLVGYQINQKVGSLPAAQDTNNSQRRSYLSSDGINFDLADIDGVPGNWAVRALVKQGSAPLAPFSVNFGTVLVNTVSDLPATLSNTSNNDLFIDSISDPSAPYSIIGKPSTFPFVIHPGDSVSFTVRFAPTTAGSPQGSILVGTHDPTNSNNPPPATTITLTGTAIQQTISVDAPGFGNVTTGKTAQKTITVSNTGATALHITVISSLAPTSPGGAGTFALSGLPNLPATIGVGGNLTFTASLTPNVRGNMSTSFTITSDGSAAPITVNLTGTGVSPTFTVNPTSAAFGTVLQNSSPNPITLTLTNTSQDALVISSISNPASPFGLTGLPAPGSFPVTVPAGQPLSFNVTFNTATGGNFNSSIIVTSNSTTSPATINVTGSVGTPQLSLSSTTIDFGPFKVGRISSKLLIISNTGNGTLQVTFGPPSDTHFTYSGITANQPVSIPGSANLTVTVNFAPDAVAPFNGTIAVTSNSNTNPNPTITLLGSGSLVNHPPTANALAFPATVNLGSTQTLKATDPDNDPLTFTIVSQPTLGVINTFNASTGVFKYTASSTGNDSFTFKVNDGVVDSNVQTVTITNVDFKFGDVNLNGTVNVNDLLTMANFLAGNLTLTPTQFQAADVLKNGVVNVQDLLTLANFLAGNLTQLPVLPGAANMPSDNLPFQNLMPSSHIAQAGTVDFEEHWLDRPKWVREPNYLQGYFGLF